MAHVGQELALQARELQSPVPGLGQLPVLPFQLLGGLLQLALRPAPLGDVVVLPEVTQILLADEDGHEVPGQHTPIAQLQLLALHGHPGGGHGVHPLEEALAVLDQRKAGVQQVADIGLHEHVGRHGNLEHAAEGLVEEGDLAPLGLHQDARLHVLDEGPQAAGGHAQDDLGVLPLGDVAEGAGHALHHAVLVVGDALVAGHPLHLALHRGHPELPLEHRLPRVHRVGEHVQVAGGVGRMEEVQEGLPQAVGHRLAGQLRPGGVEEGPAPLAIDSEDDLFQVFHQGTVAVRLRPGGGQLGLQRTGGPWLGGRELSGHAPSPSACPGPSPRIDTSIQRLI